MKDRSANSLGSSPAGRSTGCPASFRFVHYEGVRRCHVEEREHILEVINAAAVAYRGVILMRIQNSCVRPAVRRRSAWFTSLDLATGVTTKSSAARLRAELGSRASPGAGKIGRCTMRRAVDQFATTYAAMRRGLMERHFSKTRHFPALNLIRDNYRLSSGDAGGDNPLMLTGKLLVCMAAEHAVGSPHALEVIRQALASIGTLFCAHGDHFDGYPVRWDPVATDDWEESDGRYARDFLFDDGAYRYCTPQQDVRALRNLSEHEFRAMSGADQDSYKTTCLAFQRHRTWEPSMDELVGLIAGYESVHALVDDAGVRATVAEQAGRLADYLAEHSYFLVRPCGGFTYRGASGPLAAFEMPFGRAFSRITGDAHAHRHDFEWVMRKAGVWHLLQTAVAEWRAAGVALSILSPMLVAFEAIGSFRDLLEGRAQNIPMAVLGESWAVFLMRDVFDVQTINGGKTGPYKDAERAAFALNHMLFAFEPVERFDLFLLGVRQTEAWSAGFPPYLALACQRDTDGHVPLVYDEWLLSRMQRDHFYERPMVQGAPDRGIFEAAVGRLSVTPHAAWFLSRLYEYVGYLAGFGGGLPKVSADEEDSNVALDYMTAIALTWLERKRTPGILAGLPVAPTGSEWDGFSQSLTPKAAVPAPIPPAVGAQQQRTVGVVVGPRDGDVNTNIDLQFGDSFAITASGEIDTGVILAGPATPDGWDLTVDSPAYPLAAAGARRYALLAKLGPYGAYVQCGSNRPMETYRYPAKRRLYVRVNTDRLDIGGGQFTCTVTVWSVPPPDLYFVKTKNTGTGHVEVHVATSRSGYQSSGGDWSTWFSSADADNGFFQMVGSDLYFVKTKNTGTGHVEVHVATSRSGYQSSGGDWSTWFSSADADNGFFQMVGSDLYFVKTKNTGTGQVEVHVATSRSGYQSSGGDWSTWFSSADADNGFFQMVGSDLYFVKTKNTGTGQVEVHVATSRSGYQSSGGDWSTWFSSADADNGFFQMVGSDLYFVKTKNTGTGQVEVHVATSRSGYQSSGGDWSTWFSSADADNGFFQSWL